MINNFIKTIFLLFLTTQLISCTPNENQTSERQNLSHIQSFGSIPVDGFIGRASSISSDLNKYLYVADMAGAKIHKYDLDGGFERSFGKKGRGPGEFSGNISVNVDSHADTILVHDFSNYTVSFFEESGEFLTSFSINERHNAEFQFANNLLVTGHTLPPFVTTFGDEKLLHIFDKNGNFIQKFGNFIEFEEEIPAIMQKFFHDIYNDQIHLVFLYFPIYRIYDLKGNLLAEHKLDSLTNTDVQKNQEAKTFKNLPKTGTADVRGAFGGIQVVNERVFIPVQNDDYLQIDEFNLSETELTHSESYYYPLNSTKRKVIGYLDFLYIENRNSFYVLETVEGEGFVVSEYGIDI